ncbi:MAG TPA: ABC transporter permease [Candidatus Angelobacter sp.]|nr:ABC transporter permease [Candidatus Angelobacter sp.]
MRFFRRRHWDEERSRELAAYLEIETAENVARGMTPEAARTAAHHKLGNATLVREEIYRMNSLGFVETLWQDVRYGARMLRKNPGFTVIAVLTLALGIGANTAIFSMVDWLLLRQLPVPEPKALTYLGYSLGGPLHNDPGFSFPEYQEITQECGEKFDGISAFQFGGSSGSQLGPDGLTYEGKTLPLQTIFVTGNFFSMLGLRPELGRFFAAEEGLTPNADPVIVLAYEYWQSRFHGDREIIGKPVAINGHTLTVVGVAPKGFPGPAPLIHMQAYLPLGMYTLEAGTPKNFLMARDARPFTIIARLKHSAEPEQLDPALKVVGKRLLEQSPRTNENAGVLHAIPLRPPGILNGEGGNPVMKFGFLFLALGIFVLLLACLNVANLLLVRATTRQGEMAIRTALGAERLRLVRQLLTESMLLASLGCAGSVVVGALATRALASIKIPGDWAVTVDVHFNWVVFTYGFLIALLSGILVGLLPALRLARSNLNSALHNNARTTTGRRQRARNLMVAGQVAGSMTLLIVAGLFMRSLSGVQKADLGFDPHNVINFTLDTNQIGYSQARGEDFYRQLLERVRALRGVESASLAALVPIGSDTEIGGGIEVPGFEAVKGQQPPSALYNAVTRGYFATMKIQMLAGRDFNDADSAKSQGVVVINEAMAKKFWQGKEPLGREFFLSEEARRPVQIVGIMKDSRTVDFYSPIEPTFFEPLSQHYFPSQILQVRTKGTVPNLERDVMALADSLAPAIPVYGVRTMMQALNSLNGLFLFQMGVWLSGILGMLGMTLAVVGVYGVMSYSISQRTHEIGIRMAMGAQRSQILSVVGRQGLMVVATGLFLGVLAAAAISQLVAGFLVNTSPMDALTYCSVALILAASAMAACYVPARRAIRVDPIIALRNE